MPDQPPPRRWRLKVLAIAVGGLLAAILAFVYLGDDARSQISGKLHLGQTSEEVRQVLRENDVDSVVWLSKGTGNSYFFADGEYWFIEFANERIVKIEHSPDNGPFFERTRRT